MSAAISIRNLGKRYRVNHAVERAPYRTLRDSLARAAAAPLRRLRGETNGKSEEFWALKDVEFDVQPGEVVGIIGRNGAGKSTLLKILSRITSPTTGEVTINGRVGSLLEVGTGFHPELTGRENIYMNGSVLGMSRREIAKHFDDIVSFAGISRFLDTPVKRYSSGMYVRLGFAVAAHLITDVLIIDEVLAVGDAAFQERCRDKIQEIGRTGRSVLLVSHDLGMVTRLAARAVMLSAGSVQARGCTRDVITSYLAADRNSAASTIELPSNPTAPIAFCSATITNGIRGDSCLHIEEPFTLELTYEVREPLPLCRVGIIVQNGDGDAIFSSFDVDGRDAKSHHHANGLYQASCTIPAWLLNAGSYYVTLLADVPEERILAKSEMAAAFTVLRTASRSGFREDRRPGLIVPLCDWQTTEVIVRDPKDG